MPHILSRAGPLPAVEAGDMTPLRPGRIYFAPPDHHLLVSPGHVHVTKGPRENRFRPAIDPLFRTAARYYGDRVIGVILTGMLNDGTIGLLAVKRRGGFAIVQDPDDALFPSMPESALRYVDAEACLPLEEIAPRLASLTAEDVDAPENGRDVPFQLAMESKFAAMEVLDEVEKMDTIGTLAAYSCPECHGPMWRMIGEGPLRFRCHVGHAYTAETMDAGQAESLESNLWEVLRSLEERTALLRELAERARELNDPHEASTWESRIGSLQRDMVVVREMLAKGTSSEPLKSPPAPEPSLDS